MPTITYTPDAGFFGADSFTYRVTNPDGGTDVGTVNVTVNDTEIPTCSISTPTAGQQFALGTTQVSVTGVAADNDSVQLVQYRLNGGPWVAASGTTAWSATVSGLADGNSYTVEARSQDPTGNWSTVFSRSFSVAGDGTNPTVVITDPTAELAAGTMSYTVQGTAADDVAVASVQIRTDGGAWMDATGTTSWTYSLAGLSNGASVNFEARATDSGGNQSSIAQRTITVNMAPVANDDAETTPQDVALNVDVLANDVNVDAGATLTIVTPASNGSAVVVP